ncbi:MAG: histidine triad nucleotide-binding protein [Nitrospiria bacterium]
MTPPHLEENCLFCKIIQKQITANIVYEDDRALAFEDISPQAPVHLLIIPKTHIARLADIRPGDAETLAHLFTIVCRLAEEKGILEGFRTVINSGQEAGQTVFHIHIHVMGGRPFRWPPG